MLEDRVAELGREALEQLGDDRVGLRLGFRRSLGRVAAASGASASAGSASVSGVGLVSQR